MLSTFLNLIFFFLYISQCFSVPTCLYCSCQTKILCYASAGDS